MQKTVSQGFRLSPQQQHVWRAQQGEHSSAFVVQARIDIAGALDRRRLASAAKRVVERHEILRTTFPLLPSLGLPVQSVEDSAGIGWSEHSLTGQPAAAFDVLCKDIREIPFDLANGPLLRITLIELDGELHAMLLTQSALAADGASLDLLAREIAAAYHGNLEEGETFQYADLAEILHDWQGSPPEDPGPAFWRKQDLSALVRVRLGRAGRFDGHSFRPEHVSRRIGRASVEEAAARLDSTVSLILLAAWHATLHVSTGEEEIVVGTLFDGRTCLEIESALGPFARYLPMSARSGVDSTLEELSRIFSGAMAELSRRQDFFSSELIEKMLAENHASSWPFGFDYRRPRELPAASPPPRFSISDSYLGLDRFDLRLSVHDDGRALHAILVYDPALVPCDEAERLLERFSRVLDGLLAGVPLGEIDVLTESERQQALAFNRTESAVPAGLCAHQLFEEKVRCAPHAAALIHSGRTWTYAELNARANRLAHHLRASGLGPGSRVGLSLGRSPELVEAVLGILKAGAAYVPLDPGSPDARLAWMAEDAGLSLLLTDRWLEDHRVAISRQNEDDPPRSADPADLAYVIYTSGSTGQPKGVMIPHRGLVNYLLWARHAYTADKGTGAPVHSTIAFDLTVTSLLLPLAAGTAVTLLDERRSVEALVDSLRDASDTSGFSLVKLTPAHLDVLGRELRPDEYEGSTRALVIGGEALRAESVGPWREHAPQTRLINEYGPTEATVGCCVYEILPGDSADAGHVAIGRPIANTRLHVVGRRLQPVPLGAPGELWIGGDGLARGYLGRPDLTAERFVPDLFAGETGGERLYRTGDLVRLRPDGHLEFLGRIDSQIKIRGFRIEPGEIEAALVAHAAVREAAVLAAQDPAGGMELVACVAGQAEAGELRRHLADRLPEYMIPSRFAFFPTLPLTANGKVDRKELARTWREMAGAATELLAGEAPRTWTEELLAGMFAELLGVPRVGRNESFFTLGGHSLLATQTVSRVREAFGVEISLRTFFEAPTVVGLAAKVEALRLGGGTPEMPPIVPIDRAIREGPLPLSFAQQRLWFIDQLEPGSPLYNIPVALRVEGPLSSRVLALCLGEIVRRHEALRTVFAVREGAPAQEVQPQKPFELPVIDLAALPESRRAAAARTLSGEEAGRPFDLTRGPMLRGLLLRLSEGDHIAALTMHHIASDGWSMGILVREVTALYEAYSEGRLSPLPELPVQYADFAAWQHSWLHGEALEREISFWRQQLAGLPPRLELPTDRPRPAMLRFRGALRPVRLPAELTQQAQALSRREGATLFMVLMAGFHALLSRYSGQEDLAVGTPVAGRNRVEIEGLIGFFVNTLVLRGDLSGKPSFRALLGRGRDTALAAHEHQDVPFERLVQELTPERSLAHTPLFQVVLMLQNAPAESLEIRNLRLRTVGGGGTTAKFDLTLSLEEHDGGLFGTLEYATDLFDAATIDRLISHYEHLLTAAVASPELVVSELPLLPSAERHQLLAEWNDTATGRGEETLIHELFELWAARTPDAIAAVCGGETMTYGQVEERANRLAHHLAGLGIGPGSLVGIHLRRSIDMIPALLAVLKAGAAYVPLEIGHPPARLRWILDTLEISCLLTETEQLDRLPALSHAICLDRVDLTGYEPLAQPRRGTPDDLAYIIFTSGSTGTPKGVMVRHRPVVNLLRWAHETFAFSQKDRVLFVTSLSFDLSVFDVFGLLGAGGSIRIATEEEVRDPERLLRALSEEPITFWDSAPAALEQTVPFLGSIAPQESPALRLIFLSGDWIPVTLPNRIRGRFPGAQVVALGGATEATVWSNVFPVDVVDPAWPSIPYGRPIRNARYHVLEEQLAPCPVGVPGDLYIGGDCLADGYAREPELTAHKFIPDPWSTWPGARLYRTGDRARYRPDGNLEFLGRRDHQVKIRGFRIELGEIEATLAALAGVREAVVVAREDTPGDRRLVAYVVGDVPADELRQVLRERLPEHMVPAAFVTLAALPLTSNGKVDRKALPAPEWQSPEESYLAPRTAVEEGLAGIWADLLGIERVGVTDNFFDLGGHSLLATRVMSRLRETFGVEMPLRDLFEAATPAALAIRVEAALRVSTGRLIPPLAPLRRGGSLPLSFAQQRLWFIDQLEPGSPLYNVPVALRVEGPLRSDILALCLGEIARRHEVLRTVFAAAEGTPVQVIQPATPFSLSVADLSGFQEREREALALASEEAGRPFDLARGPLMRALLIRLAENDHVLTLTLHHIVSDGWSMGILIREVTALYAAFSESRPSPLPELPVQYADFAAWQRSWLRGENLEREISFWRRQLAGLPPRLELPTDHPRPATRSFRGASRLVRLPSGLTRQAQALGRRDEATLFMVLLAGFQALLARYSGQEDVAVGTPVAGRNRAEIEGLIGVFVNTLVLRGNLAGEPSFEELLGRVRETALAAHTHQDLPFEKLVQELSPERSLAQAPLFQVVFGLQNAPAESLHLQDLRLRPVSTAGTTAKFDLSLILEEHDGEILGQVEHATDLFDGTTIDRLIVHYERLLTAALETPEIRVSELPLLTRAESHQLLAEWRGTGGQPTAATLHAGFEAHASRVPEAAALTCGSSTLSYGELNRRSNRLARRLRAHGIGPESRVGLCLERSSDLVVGILGILKAGGAYVPLDPGYPRERLAYMIENAGVQVVVGLEESVANLPHTGRLILLDVHREELAMLPDGDLEPLADGESLAYVIYTSGSTGRPKGVLVSHGNVARLFDATRDGFGFGEQGEQDVWTLFHSYAFDFSVWEIWGALLHGGRLAIVPHDVSRSPEMLLDLIIREQVTVLNQTPSAFAQLARIDEERGGASTRLRLIIFGGEALDPASLATWFARHGDERPRLINMYGITETTVHVTQRPLRTEDSRVSRRSIIGVPLPDLALAVMEPGLRPVPIGVPGELVIGGAGLARGYLGRPELTAERFVPDPAGLPGARLYRSGDLGRFLPNGEVEYLGRIDHQVKIRGFRVEPGEVEAALLALPAVREAVVIAREDTPGDRRLVAYVATDLPADELRQTLRERLPDHMVPAAFVTLAALPLTANGKVDRKALPAPEWQSSEESYLAPRTPVEEALTGIWADLLGIERVGVSDNFFDLGGHSLLATRVMSRLRETFAVEMPLRDLFEAATPAALAIRVEAALRVSTGRLIPPLASLRRGGSLPLSFAQQRLWFIDQLEPGSPLYNVPVALRVEGPLRSDILALCLGEIARRHEVLRTVFAAAEGTPVQVIQPATPFNLSVVDLSGLAEREHETLALASEEASRPFDLARGPLMRARLIRLAEDDHVLTLTLHHIVSDGWSMGILIREVAALYAAFSERRPSPLPVLPVQYADFAAWQRSWLRGENLESEISFWRRQLAGLPPRLELPTDHPRPAARSFRGASRIVRLPSGLTRQAQALGRRDEATLFMVLLAGFQALLARYSGQQDFAVGTPIAGRNRIEIEGLIGVFVNTLVLRGNLTGEPSFEELLGRVRETALAAHTHQDLPFEKLVQELSPERSLAQAPLFQVVFGLQNTPVDSVHLQGLRLRPVSTAGTTAKFDLSLILEEHDGEILGQVEHATDLFDGPTIDRLIVHYERLLTAALETPEIRVSELSLLTDAESHQLLAEWRGTGGQPTATTLHAGFEAHAWRTPEAAALTCGDSTLSYGELNRRSNRLARRLRAQGIGPESRVGLCLERSSDLVVGILGILKAGGAYVPLDPGYPRERLAYMIEDAGVEVVVGLEESVADLPHTGRLILLDVHREELAMLPDGDLEPLADGESLAYVIYTSGSTGRPKGVLVSHGNVARLFNATRDGFGFGEQDVWTLFHSYAFDFSVWEIWGALLHGGRLVIVPHDVSRSPEMFLDLIIREQVTVLNQTPSAFAQLARVDEERGGASTRLRLIIFGGEALDPASLAPWFARHGDERPSLINMYGITETTVHVTQRPLLTEDSRAERRSIIGVPLPDLALAVMDPGLRPVPIGVPGELVIGGAGLARGYLGRPELTAERFVPDPAGLPGARLYRSGDLGRFLPNGEVEYLGRIDHQVKIRGFRVEPGEIEAALLSLPAVREAVVIAREDTPGDRRLVAYVATDVPADELRQVLRERLPEHMVPAAFVTLAALPLTSNGKVDRKALPAPEWQSSDESYLAPRTPVEESLARLFGEILRAERIGVRDSFFELGGHSLLATRLMAAVRDHLGVDLPLRVVFERPTVEGLAQAVSEAMKAGAPADDPNDSITALPRQPGENQFPVSFSQLREWILDRLEPGNPTYNIPSPLRIEGPLAVPALVEALRTLVRRHEVFRTQFPAGEEEPLQAVLPEVRLEVPVIDLSALPEGARETELRRQAGDEAATGFDLFTAPLLRARIVRVAREDHALLLTLHHIISDGWSLGILNRELAALYEAGAETCLPPLPVQYADYAVWQRQRLQGEALERQAGFWRQQLSGAPPLLELPTDRPRPPVRSNRGGKVPFHLPQPLAGRLGELARQHGATLFMVLLAGVQSLLGRWSGQDDVVVGTYSGNRSRRELEGLIGFFINTLALRTRLPEDSSFAALLGRVRESILEAYAHADLPFEKLLETLQLPRDPSRTPVFQALLVLQNFPPTRADLSTGVRLSSLEVASEKVDYDLELWLGEGPDGISGSLRYSAALFDEATMARFAGQLRTFLEAAVANPEQNLWTLPLLASDEQTAQLLAWSRGPAVPAGEPLLHRLVQEQADRTPDAVALEAGSLRLTYAQLVDRASRQAGWLREQGVSRGSIVALPAERTPDLIVSMLAVLQAGAAYLPLDPAYPRDRRELMVKDSGAVLLPSNSPIPGDGEIGGSFAASEDDAAYLLYTSGSTGLPKGVVVPHRAIASFVRAARETYGLAPGDRVLQFASLSFDTSAEEIWPALASGATLVLRPDDMAASIPHFLRELGRLGITVLDLPTAFWHEMVLGMDAGNLDLPRGLRLVILGGEEALADRFALWHRRAGSSVRLVNTYGPTETTVVATRRELADLAPGGLIPIGKPIPGVHTHVLDRFSTPVPPGVRGELWIGGAGVARGYLGRPDLTAERFVPDPFSEEPGARLYRTGDLAYLRPDGDLVFAGRADRQLKVRGYRIEPGEIEAALRLHPAVRDAVADARGTGDLQRLVAWIVPREGSELPAAADLRAFLRDRLPEPMVPAVFAPVSSLPLSPTGKVDRRALPEPAGTQSEQRTHAEPRSALERTIAEIYRGLLQVARIGLNDNFFDLGGHSLLIVRAHQKLKEALGREIPVLDLFRFPTVASLARHLGGEDTGSLEKVQTLAEQQRAAQQRRKAAMERLGKHGGSKV